LILPNRNSEAEMIKTRTKLIGATIAVIGFTIPFGASAHERHDPWLTAAGVALTYAHYSDHADRHYHGHRYHRQQWRGHHRGYRHGHHHRDWNRHARWHRYDRHRWHHWRAHDRHGRGHEHERDRRGERRHRYGH
jgi:hypothetical protein